MFIYGLFNVLHFLIMNIHFTDKSLLNQLLNATLVKVLVGSHMYTTNNENSDKDYLCIYVPTLDEHDSFTSTHHQYQYKDEENNIDYIFVNLYAFINNTLSGDSTINFEVIHSGALQNTPLEFLDTYKLAFCNYNIIRSYLGMARRDLKHIGKYHTDRDKNKKLSHAYRSYAFASNILQIVENPKYYFDVKIAKYSYVREYLEITDYRDRKNECENVSLLINSLRMDLNSIHDSNEIIKYIDPKYSKLIDEHLYKLTLTKEYKDKQNRYFPMELIYDAIENGVNY